MVLPRKADILQKATSKALERQVRAGLPALTPEEHELKESGTFEEARVDLMRDAGAVSEQLKYLSEMAGEMKLKVIPIGELGTLKKETGYEWTNGWTKHKKRKPKTGEEIAREKFQDRMRRTDYFKKQAIKRMEAIPFDSGQKQEKPQRVSLRQPLDVGGAIRGAPKPRMPSLPQPKKFRKQDDHLFEMIGLKPKPKPKKRHIQRTGKTMRVLRKRVKDGQKAFSFPDHIWKVRK